MAFGEVGYAEQGGARGLSATPVERPSTIDRLATRKRQLETELESVNAALDALKTNPEVARVVEALARVAY